MDEDLISRPVPPGETVGRIHPALVGELGLPNNVLLVSGGHDQTCAALGLLGATWISKALSSA